MPVIVGGIIPEADVGPLKAAGVAAVYTPKDFDLTQIMRDVVGARGGGERARRGHGLPSRAWMADPTGAALGARLRDRDLGAAPAALNLVENRAPARRPEIEALLAEVSPAALGGEARRPRGRRHRAARAPASRRCWAR